MISRRQLKLLTSAIIVIVSILAIIASDTSSELSKPTLDPQITNSPDPEQIGESGQVEGAYITSFPYPSLLLTEDPENPNPDSRVEGYRVVKVIDGDTVDVQIEDKLERLRLIGIDTPETVDPRKEIQCFGKEASNKAKDLLEGKIVTLESDDSQGDKDKYKRLLRYVFLPDGTNFNQHMISEGYAYEYTYDEPYKYQAEFKNAQFLATSQNKGLWSSSTCSGSR